MYIIILLLSIWQSILFWGKEPGISVILFVLPFVIFLIKSLKKQKKIKNEKAKLIAIPILLLSATYFIFNNGFLNNINIIAIPGLIVIMVIELICEEFTLEKVLANILEILFKPIGYVGKIISDITKKIKKDEKNCKEQKQIKRIIKSIAISIPIIMFIFILLVTADRDFSKLFINIFKLIDDIKDCIKISDMTERIFVIFFAFFYMAGFIKNIYLTNDIDRNIKAVKQKDNLSIKFILTILNTMYLVFCIIQVKSLFNIYSMNKNNINYSYYARQGFFQLMIVSAINLVLILKSKKKCYNQEKYINVMDLSMIVLTSVILITSFIRMYLYEQSYGFTIKRILVFWAEITEGILFIPTVMYVLDKKINLAKAYFIVITSMYVILNFANINRIIAYRNVNMYLERGNVSNYDVYEITKLGSDVIPEIIRLADLIDETEKEKIESEKQFWSIEQILNEYENKYKYENNYDLIYLVNVLKETYNKTANMSISWQEFNISKINAKRELRKL